MTRSDLPDLTGQTVLVTGASGGIGSAVARRFADAGAAVVVHGHHGREQAERLAAELTARECRAVALTADLTDEAACRRLVADSAAWSGRLTGLVNCAGVQPVRQLAEMTTAEWRQVVDTNLAGAFTCTQAAVPVLAAHGGGSVTHIASIEGSHPAFQHAHYCASKAALIMHARSAALEYGPLGVRVNTVSPGLIDRPGLDGEWPEGVRRWKQAAPLGRLGTGQDVGNACVFLASGLASWITGHDLVVDGGVSSAPTW
ncbi:SDR family NAD(P)-dependent oxidoreductase [Streptomyces clavuligerus]|uniref:Glucose 1-dehydrogenase n=1 Tax=Streptomyces clavuligerus TaxID=1901 RepID=B5GV85_STRCL|nr:SDR family NAD(P)-dependent oxidoreductase [Streptomyces clavuligerus]ANW20152.1 short-chain dehydrogenase [Streptomyces clavuligerus]AXU14779.1 SDR family oxidoreductase [Streptomyces clavuligerus]EDY50231.1 glucose 1-dehydrogenase [Streptomyces clavuligerus]EFG06938.1 glucose 1-dehydrogenase [Streptomyces clavuligerus]MBY6304807.1 SDR family oxidoreductase [Streptomyces clavuligerus]